MNNGDVFEAVIRRSCAQDIFGLQQGVILATMDCVSDTSHSFLSRRWMQYVIDFERTLFNVTPAMYIVINGEHIDSDRG
jgi:hypothetical protein